MYFGVIRQESEWTNKNFTVVYDYIGGVDKDLHQCPALNIHICDLQTLVLPCIVGVRQTVP